MTIGCLHCEPIMQRVDRLILAEQIMVQFVDDVADGFCLLPITLDLMDLSFN